jgi:hypothetical protein
MMAIDVAPASGLRIASRARPTVVHLLCSALVAGVGTLLLLWLWYPQPYATLSGGRQLLAILLTVDIVLGPVLTFVVAAPGKLVRVLARDMAVIVAVQLAALGYGVHVLAQARPIGLVFEVDQMRVVSAADVDAEALANAPPALRELSWLGPRTFAAVKPTNPDELLSAIQLGMSGVDLAMLPQHWRTYETHRDMVLAKSRPVAVLLQRYPDIAPELESLARSAQARVTELRFLPLRSRHAADWITVVAAPDARVVGHLHRDGFF